MSLAIPYILDAAAETSPGATVEVAGHNLTVKVLNHRSIVGAERYLHEGYRPGDHIPLPSMTSVGQVIDVLAATRVGLILSDGAVPALSHSDAPHMDRDVAESRIWSEIPAAVIGSRVLTHGDVIRAVDTAGPEGLAPLGPVLAVLRSIRTVLTQDTSRPLGL